MANIVDKGSKKSVKAETEVKTSKPVTKKTSKPKTVVVKNVSALTQHNKGVYFSPGLEVRTELDSFVQGSIDSGTFVVIEGK